MQYYLGGCALLLFFALLGGRVAFMRRKGVNVIVFGQTDKSDFLLVPIFLFFIYIVLTPIFKLPLWKQLAAPFWRSTVPGWLGLVLCLAALVGFVVTLKSFGNSFRVGIDENNPDKLVTNGMFAFSRNPLYVCFLLFFFGMFLVQHNLIMTIVFILFVVIINRQIIREENFLKKHYGLAYDDYCKKVRRYL